jgi:VIT1/CCC1 family predicted Fe2+/Mn2+ transporter
VPVSEIVVLAVSDALSDAMGIHVSEEAEDEHSAREIWEASAFTFLSKLSITLTFLVPITLLELQTAVATSAIWGLLLVAFFSFWMAKSQKKNPYKAVAEHIMITILVIILTNYLGFLVYQIFMG